MQRAHSWNIICCVRERERAGGEKTQCEGDEGRFEINTSSLPRRILRGVLTSSGRIRDTTSQTLFAAYYVVREHAGCAPQPAANCSHHFWGRFTVGASQVTAPTRAAAFALRCPRCVLSEFMRKQVYAIPSFGKCVP